MTTSDDLWSLLAALEAQLPLQRDKLEAFFGTTFEVTRDHNRQALLVGTTPRYAIELRPATDSFAGNMTIRFTPPVRVGSRNVYERFPDGHSVPPPPPGIGPSDLEGAYVANLPWGQVWFTFYSGDRLTQISIGPGQRGSPGV